MRRAFLFTAILGLLPTNWCLAQFFTPVSTVLDAETWIGKNVTYENSPVQGPDDYEDFGSQAGTHQASSQLGYLDPGYMTNLYSTADGSASIDPESGTISVSLNTTTNSGDPVPAQGLATATIVFDVPPDSGIHLGLDMDALNFIYNFTSASLDGPDGLSWQEVSSEDIPSIPAGQYTLMCLAGTQVVTGTGFGGQNLTTITIVPEPSGLMLAAGILSLVPIRRRRI